ncbi:MAG TPA: methyltransferase domain-containing protein [Burkholderiales bacterium]|jgi:SAM-dependent methyltransferase|nr:methyltransferase domain-containing protein [Burkholderiales bacterium]
MADVPADFGGSIPEFYDRIMGPAHFDVFGAELARRLPARPPGDVLEVACGTGLVTRHLRERASPDVKVVASDISRAMLDYARGKLAAARGVEWREADACKLPFGNAAFGAVVCAFGVMFVPDKAACFREARRVLRKGGTFLFNVWDGLDNNPHGRVAAEVIEGLLPGDPAARFGSIPYHFNDRAAITRLLEDAGFAVGHIGTVRISCTSPSAREFAIGQLRGTPRSLILQERGIPVDGVIEKVAAALARLGGAEPFRYTAQALVVEARAI